MKRITAVLLAMVLALCLLVGCSSGSSTSEPAESTEAAEAASTEAAAEDTEEVAEDEEEPDTGDASLDDPLNQDEIGEKEILVVSFGTSFNDSRVATIGGIEKAIAAAYPDWSVRRAFTSDIIINHVKERDGEVIDTIEEALIRARENGVKQLVIQPTHLMAGNEYDELMNVLSKYQDVFEQISVGQPLLTSDDDKSRVADELITFAEEYTKDGDTAVCFMGHGTNHESNAIYAEMQTVFTDKGANDIYVGTVEATPSIDDVLAAVQANEAYKKVVLRDMMVVAGDHANNDMADPEDPESWYSTFAGAGYEVTPVLEGLGQVPAIQQIYVEHVQAAIDSLGQ